MVAIAIPHSRTKNKLGAVLTCSAGISAAARNKVIVFPMWLGALLHFRFGRIKVRQGFSVTLLFEPFVLASWQRARCTMHVRSGGWGVLGCTGHLRMCIRRLPSYQPRVQKPHRTSTCRRSEAGESLNSLQLLYWRKTSRRPFFHQNSTDQQKGPKRIILDRVSLSRGCRTEASDLQNGSGSRRQN